MRSISFPDGGSRDRDIIFRDRTYLVFCFLGFLVKFQVREANKCVYLSANRFSMEFRLSFLHEFEKWINTPVI